MKERTQRLEGLLGFVIAILIVAEILYVFFNGYPNDDSMVLLISGLIIGWMVMVGRNGK